jgi:hypothetical protein
MGASTEAAPRPVSMLRYQIEGIGVMIKGWPCVIGMQMELGHCPWCGIRWGGVKNISSVLLTLISRFICRRRSRINVKVSVTCLQVEMNIDPEAKMQPSSM